MAYLYTGPQTDRPSPLSWTDEVDGRLLEKGPSENQGKLYPQAPQLPHLGPALCVLLLCSFSRLSPACLRGVKGREWV